MTEYDWFNGTDLSTMFRFVQTTTGLSWRKNRLFAVALCLDVPEIFTLPSLRLGIDVAGRYADGLASDTERSLAFEGCPSLIWAQGDTKLIRQIQIATNCLFPDGWESQTLVMEEFLTATPHPIMPKGRPADILREIFNPFRRGGTNPPRQAVSLAKVIYREKDWEALPVLADACEEEGWGDEELLKALRGEIKCPSCLGAGWAKKKTPFFRGSWALDEILEKT